MLSSIAHTTFNLQPVQIKERLLKQVIQPINAILVASRLRLWIGQRLMASPERIPQRVSPGVINWCHREKATTFTRLTCPALTKK